MGDSPATAHGLLELTAAEYVVLLARGSTPADGPVVRAALVECVVRGLLRVERRTVRGMFRPRNEWHLVPGAGEAPRVLAPVLSAVAAAPEVEDAEGRRGRTVTSVVAALRKASDGATFADLHVLPALFAAGHVVDVKPPRWFRTSRFTLTPVGEATATEGDERIAAARAAVDAVPSRGEEESVREARLVAATALGAAGVLVVAEKDLLTAASEIRRALAGDGGSGGDATFLVLTSGHTGSVDDDATRMGEMFDAVDAGAFDAADGGGSGGDGGGDGGGGGGD